MSRFESYLRSNLSKYTHEAKARNDIVQALTEYTDLRPKLEKFTFNNGETRDLMALNGTLPVQYQRNTYNIPVAIFLLEPYPFTPPLVYVRPTSTMQIKPNKHVDSNGKVYLPYLTEWKHPQSDLSGLFSILQIVFQDQPPVFAKPTGASGPPNQQPGRAQQPPPYPPTGTGYSAGPPPYPYPTGGPTYPGMGMPHPQQPSGASTGLNSYVGSAWGTPGGNSSYMGPYPTYPVPNQQNYTPTQSANLGSSALSEAEMNESLRTAVEDKLKRRLREAYAQHKTELDKLEKTESQLNERRNILENMMVRADNEEEELKKTLTIISEKNKEIDEYLRRHEKEDRLNVDETVDTTVPLYRQLFNAFAEEQAIEDAIYYLAEAHRRGVIDLDTFLKTIRDLSREQFMLRVTVQKCRVKAGLPDL